MVCKLFQIDRGRQLLDHFGFAATCKACDQYKFRRGNHLRKFFNKKTAHGLVAADDAGVGQASLGQPLLRDAGAQAASKAVQISLGVFLRESHPLRDALFFGVARNKRIAKNNGSVLTCFFVM